MGQFNCLTCSMQIRCSGVNRKRLACPNFQERLMFCIICLHMSIIIGLTVVFFHLFISWWPCAYSRCVAIFWSRLIGSIRGLANLRRQGSGPTSDGYGTPSSDLLGFGRCGLDGLCARMGGAQLAPPSAQDAFHSSRTHERISQQEYMHWLGLGLGRLCHCRAILPNQAICQMPSYIEASQRFATNRVGGSWRSNSSGDGGGLSCPIVAWQRSIGSR